MIGPDRCQKAEPQLAELFVRAVAGTGFSSEIGESAIRSIRWFLAMILCLRIPRARRADREDREEPCWSADPGWRGRRA